MSSYEIDKQWMKESNQRSARYIEGVKKFKKFILENGGKKTIFSCPCTRCRNGKGQIPVDDIEYHLLKSGFDQSYTVWRFHGERVLEKRNQQSTRDTINNNDEFDHPRMEDLVDDARRFHHCETTNSLNDHVASENIGEHPEYNTHEEGIKNPPKNVSYEDWEQFCKNEGTKEAENRRKQGKINRSYYSYGHSNDIISQASGKDNRGRTRSIGTQVSRTQVKVSAPARSLLKSAQSETKELKVRMDSMESTLSVLVGTVNSLREQLKGTRHVHNSPVFASNEMGSTTQSTSPHNTCVLVNFDNEIVATGVVVKDSTAQSSHGCSVPATHEKVALDTILLPAEKTAKENHAFAKTFADVGVGGYVVHPKFAIRYR